jgi:hypothetical protein
VQALAWSRRAAPRAPGLDGTPSQPARGRARDVRSPGFGMGSTSGGARRPGLGGLRPSAIRGPTCGGEAC